MNKTKKVVFIFVCCIIIILQSIFLAVKKFYLLAALFFIISALIMIAAYLYISKTLSVSKLLPILFYITILVICFSTIIFAAILFVNYLPSSQSKEPLQSSPSPITISREKKIAPRPKSIINSKILDISSIEIIYEPNDPEITNKEIPFHFVAELLINQIIKEPKNYIPNLTTKITSQYFVDFIDNLYNESNAEIVKNKQYQQLIDKFKEIFFDSKLIEKMDDWLIVMLAIFAANINVQLNNKKTSNLVTYIYVKNDGKRMNKFIKAIPSNPPEKTFRDLLEHKYLLDVQFVKDMVPKKKQEQKQQQEQEHEQEQKQQQEQEHEQEQEQKQEQEQEHEPKQERKKELLIQCLDALYPQSNTKGKMSVLNQMFLYMYL